MATGLAAQETHRSIALSAGTATDIAGVSSSALTLSPSLAAVGPQYSFLLTATGTRFSNRAWSAGVSSAFSGRGGESAIAPTIDLAASAATTSYSFSYGIAEATPALEGRFGPVRAFGGVHLSAASASRVLNSPAATPLGSVVPASTSATSNTGAAGVAGATMTFAAPDGESIALTLRGERGTVAGATQTDNSVGATIGNDNVALSASLGERRVTNVTTGFGSGALTIALSPAIALQLAAGKYPANRLLGTPAGQFVNAGAVIRLGISRSSLPRPAGVGPTASGMTRLSIRADDATTVDVAGEFNHWEFVSARLADNGVWFADLRIPPGQYRYAFRINGKEWRIPGGVVAAEDEFGGKSAWLTVTPTAGRPE